MWTYFAPWKSVSQSLFIFNMKIDSISRLSECYFKNKCSLIVKIVGLAFIDISVDFQSKFYSNSHKQSTKQRNYISDQPKRCLQKTKLMEFKILKHLQLEFPGSNPQSRRKCSTCRNLSEITELWTPTSEGSITAVLQC